MRQTLTLPGRERVSDEWLRRYIVMQGRALETCKATVVCSARWKGGEIHQFVARYYLRHGARPWCADFDAALRVAEQLNAMGLGVRYEARPYVVTLPSAPFIDEAIDSER